MGNASGGREGLGRATPEQSLGSPLHRLPLSPTGTTAATAALMAAPSLGKEPSRRPAPGQAAGGSPSQSKQQPRRCPAEHLSNCQWPQPRAGDVAQVLAAGWHGKSHEQPPVTPGKALLQQGSGTAGHPLALPGTHAAAAHGDWKWHKDVTLDSVWHEQRVRGSPAAGTERPPKCCAAARLRVPQTHLFGSHVREVSQGPEAVLDQPGAGAGQVLAQRLHAACQGRRHPPSCKYPKLPQQRDEGRDSGSAR